MSNKSFIVPAALVGLAALLTSCSVKEDRISTSKVFVDVRTFDLDQTSISTKASSTSVPHRIAFKAIDSDGTTAYECSQVAGQAGYGTLEFELCPGNYTLVAVAHDVSDTNGEIPEALISSGGEVSLPEQKVYDTFCGTKAISVEPRTPFSAGMTLPRVNSQFQICISDAIPQNVKRIEITANASGAVENGPASFNPANGHSLKNRQYKSDFDISKEAGKTNLTVGINILLTAKEQDIDVAVTAYDSSNQILASHTITNIPMKQNRRTIATGKFFSASGAGSFTFNTAWETVASISY